MKNYKKIISVVLGLLLVLNIAGCTNNEKEEPTAKKEDFDTFIEKMPNLVLSDDDMNLEFTFQDPSNYGFEEQLLTLPYSNEKSYKKVKKKMKKYLRN